MFAASTSDATNDTTLWAPWVAGDLKYLVIPRAAPVVGAISTRTVTAGATVSFQISATDAAVATSALNYTLVNPPAGATINPTNHFFSWRPTIAQSPSTNVITVKVSVNGSPTLSTPYSFLVVVNRPPAPTLSQAAMTNGIFSMRVSGVNGPDYQVWSSTNLGNGTLPQQNVSPSVPFTFTDFAATNFSQ